jgi:hypothetical protein
MECAQINITGGGSKSPATVSFPGAYKGECPSALSHGCMHAGMNMC